MGEHVIPLLFVHEYYIALSKMYVFRDIEEGMEGSILKNEAFLVIVLFVTVLAAHSVQGLAIPKWYHLNKFIFTENERFEILKVDH